MPSGESFHEGVERGIRYRVYREGQVLGLSAEDAWSAELAPRARDVSGASDFTSAAVLAMKAKQVDDGLYAALDLAAQHGAGRLRGKHALLEAVLERMSGDGDARATLEAAASLGVNRPCATGRASEIRAAFLADELRSKPIGFYTWTDALSRVFRQDRLLQTDLSGAADLGAVGAALRSDPPLRATYEACVRLPEQLTNALASADLREVLDALDRGRAPETTRPIAFLPASKAHETELVKRLFGDRPIPTAFDLSRELVRAVRSGELDLTPKESSGWYDLQTWALETLCAPERGAEAKSLELDTTYRAHLEELLRGILTATRETHVKQLMPPPAGGRAPRLENLFVAPHLSAEPLVTYYKRRADAYRFVRAMIAETFGEEALETIHGVRHGGLVEQPLGRELAAIIHLFDGAAATSMRELGMPTEWASTAFDAWRAGRGDPDIDTDARLMVPVFFDVARRKTKVWMILGWSRRSLLASFAQAPRIEVLGDARIDVATRSATYPVATPVMVEAYVSRILDRDEFRAHCDRHRTREAIVGALA